MELSNQSTLVDKIVARHTETWNTSVLEARTTRSCDVERMAIAGLLSGGVTRQARQAAAYPGPRYYGRESGA